MITSQQHLFDKKWKYFGYTINQNNCQFVLAFGSSELLKDPKKFDHLRKLYPNADI